MDATAATAAAIMDQSERGRLSHDNDVSDNERSSCAVTDSNSDAAVRSMHDVTTAGTVDTQPAAAADAASLQDSEADIVVNEQQSCESRVMDDVSTAAHSCCSADRPQHQSAVTQPMAAATGVNPHSDDGGVSLGGGLDLDALIAHQRALLSRVTAQRDDFLRQVAVAQTEIERAAQQMKSAVENRVNELLVTAHELRTERETQLDEARTQLEAHAASMNQHRQFASELLTTVYNASQM